MRSQRSRAHNFDMALIAAPEFRFRIENVAWEQSVRCGAPAFQAGAGLAALVRTRVATPFAQEKWFDRPGDIHLMFELLCCVACGPPSP